MIPGLALHQALRKRFIERVVRAALARGCRQVVVLGAGFDTLALRLHKEFPEVNFLELDHPATQRIKKEVIEREGAAGVNLTLAPLDLSRRPLDEFLAERPEFQSNRAAVFVCEGVLMYFTAEQVDGLFAALGRLNPPALRFVFTAMEPDRRGRVAFRNSTWLVRLWLHRANEIFRWGLRREETGAFLQSRDFALIETASKEELLGTEPDGLSRYTIAEGEFVCVSDWVKRK